MEKQNDAENVLGLVTSSSMPGPVFQSVFLADSKALFKQLKPPASFEHRPLVVAFMSSTGFSVTVQSQFYNGFQENETADSIAKKGDLHLAENKP